MSQRNSGYERKAGDLYETPAWVTATLCRSLPQKMHVMEPACGSGKMVTALSEAGHRVDGYDISHGIDFLKIDRLLIPYDAIITNPPFGLATEFIEHALQLMCPRQGIVAMLLRCDYDFAQGRTHLFEGHPAFRYMLHLKKRIVWFERADGRRPAPSFYHMWCVWDWTNKKDPIVLWGP